MSFTPKGPKDQPEKGFKPKVDTPKYNSEKEPNKPSDKPAFIPDAKPRNKIEPYTIPPDYKPKNKIEQYTLPPNYKPKNKIERHVFPPNYKPKNKIERTTLPLNYTPKNKIKHPTLPPNYKPKNKIECPKLPLNYKPKNKIEPHTIPPNYKPKNKIEQHTLPPNFKPKNKIERPILPPNYTPKNKIKPHELPANYNSKNKIQIPENAPKTTPQSNPRIVYSEKDVRYWIQQYQNHKSFEKVQNHLRDEGKKVPAISTLKNRIKDLIGPEEYKKLMKKYNFSDAKKIVKLTGISKTGVPGKILSNPEEFKGVKSKLLYQCGKCDHSWKTTLDAIVNSKHWCPKCATKSRIDAQRGSVGEHQNIITQKGGKLIGVIYEDPTEKLFNQRTRLKIECEAGHKFNIKASNLKQGKWCRKCSYEVIGEKHRGSFQDIQKLIEKRGGHCLSKPEDYKNQHQKLKIRCSENHIFESAPTNFIRGDWCPQCSQGKFERLSRKFFEEIFQKEFPKERPNWLVNSRGNQMELDGYNKDLKLAFQAQGEQHYRAVPHFNQTLDNLEQRIKDDLRKLDLCKQNDVILIQVPYYIPISKRQQYIINQYESLSNQKLPNIPDIDYNKFYNTKNDQKKMDNYL